MAIEKDNWVVAWRFDKENLLGSRYTHATHTHSVQTSKHIGRTTGASVLSVFLALLRFTCLRKDAHTNTCWKDQKYFEGLIRNNATIGTPAVKESWHKNLYLSYGTPKGIYNFHDTVWFNAMHWVANVSIALVYESIKWKVYQLVKDSLIINEGSKTHTALQLL